MRELLVRMVPVVAGPLHEVTDHAFIIRWVDEVRCRDWAHGRAVLVGDAAHAMSPHLGQGANSALLDGLALAESLSESGVRSAPNKAALKAYEDRRRTAVTRVQRIAVAYQRISESCTYPGLRQTRTSATS